MECGGGITTNFTLKKSVLFNKKGHILMLKVGQGPITLYYLFIFLSNTSKEVIGYN